MPTRFLQLAPADVRLPDWGWHCEDLPVTEKLANSLERHGQLQPVVVRELADGAWEVVDGRRRVAVLRRLNAPHVTAYSVGRLSDADAVRVALDLELAAEVDYAKLAQQVARLAAAVDEPEGLPARLAATAPWDAARVAHFIQLAGWDWSQYRDAADEQAGFAWGAAEAYAAEPAGQLAPAGDLKPPEAALPLPEPVEVPGAANAAAAAEPDQPFPAAAAAPLTVNQAVAPPPAAEPAPPQAEPADSPAAPPRRRKAASPPRQPELQEPLFWDDPPAEEVAAPPAAAPVDDEEIPF